MPLVKTTKRKLRHRLVKLITYDAKLYAEHAQTTLLIGFDEVGRGCVAGPVCTAAYSCKAFYDDPDDLFMELKRSQQLNPLLLLDDSKRVPHAKRDALCMVLLDLPSKHILHSVNFQSAQKIDSDGIIAAIYTSMAINLLELVLQYTNLYNKQPTKILLLIDGTKTIANLLDLLDQELDLRKISNLKFVIAGQQQPLRGAIILEQQNIIRGDGLSASIAAASNLAKQARDSYMKIMDLDFTVYGWCKNVGYGTRRHLEAISTHGLQQEHRRSFLSNRVTNHQ